MRCTFTGWIGYRGPLGQPSQCYVQVYEGAGRLPVVIATELDDNDGASLTNAAGEAATTVWQLLLPHAREGMTWIEHYPAHDDAPGRYRRAETFDTVTFRLVGPFQLANPDWRPSSRDAVEALVGALVGAPLPADEVG